MLEGKKARDYLVSSFELNRSIGVIIDLAKAFVQLDETGKALEYLGKIAVQEIPDDLMVDCLNAQAEIAFKKNDSLLAEEVDSQLSGLELSAPFLCKIRDEIRSALSEMQVDKERSKSLNKEIRRVDLLIPRISNKISGHKNRSEKN